MITYPYSSQKIKLQSGETINYMDVGKGAQTLLMIHGLANYAPAWKKNMEQLSKQYRCIAIDLPGNGLSSVSQQPYSMTYFAQTVLHLIEKLGLKQVTLVGHSMGGQVCMHAYLQVPQLFEKLILCAPAGFEHFTSFEQSVYQSTMSFFDFFSSEENSLRKLIRSSFYHNTHQGDEMVQDLVFLMQQQPIQQYRKMVDQCISSMLNEPVYDKLEQVKIPCLILFGERDALIPNKLLHPITTRTLAEQAAKRMPKSELHILSGAGHFLHWEKPNEINELMIEFLNKN